MGRARNDRLQISVTDCVVALAALAIGAAAPRGFLEGETNRLLVTFIGIVCASILPTTTLAINGMSSGGWSVLFINNLHEELSKAVRSLFAIFSLGVISVAILIALSMPTPSEIATVPYVSEILNRSGQALCFCSVALMTFRLRLIPQIIQSALRIRRDLAVDEARRKLDEKAPTKGNVEAIFPTDSSFGETVTLNPKPKPKPAKKAS